MPLSSRAMQYREFLQSIRAWKVPNYQRPYSWDKDNVQALLETLQKSAELPTVGSPGDQFGQGIFLGNIILVDNDPGGHAGKEVYSIIDGQQRLITTFLIVRAFSKEAGLEKEIWVEDILFERRSEGEKPKLTLGEDDNPVFQKIICGKEISEKERDHHLYKMYDLIEKEVTGLASEKDWLERALLNTCMIQITLSEYGGQPHPLPQDVFETTNSRGRDLSPVDLIRNFSINQVPEGEKDSFYKNYWRRLENKFRGKGDVIDENSFGQFIRAFVEMNGGSAYEEKEEFEQFKTLCQRRTEESPSGTSSKAIKDLFTELDDWVPAFRATRFDDETSQILEQWSKKDAIKEIAASLKMIIGIRQNTQSAVLSMTLLYHLQKESNKKEIIFFQKTFKLIETYLFLRWIESQDKYLVNYRKMFATCAQQIHKDLSSGLSAEVVYHKMINTLVSGFPSKNSIEECVREKSNWYNNSLRKFVLKRLMSEAVAPATPGAKHRALDYEKINVEHILPQSVLVRGGKAQQDSANTELWREYLGDDWRNIAQRLTNNIGNLTITNVNSSLNNRPYKDTVDENGATYEGKRSIFLKEDIPLNQDISKRYSDWREKEILQRAQEIGEAILKFWDMSQYQSEPHFGNYTQANSEQYITLFEEECDSAGSSEQVQMLATRLLEEFLDLEESGILGIQKTKSQVVHFVHQEIKIATIKLRKKSFLIALPVLDENQEKLTLDKLNTVSDNHPDVFSTTRTNFYSWSQAVAFAFEPGEDLEINNNVLSALVEAIAATHIAA